MNLKHIARLGTNVSTRVIMMTGFAKLRRRGVTSIEMHAARRDDSLSGEDDGIMSFFFFLQ